MPTHLGWQEIGLRLTLTVLAGLVMGLDRERLGRPAGLRTTVLVCLAASVSMIQANLLLPTNGKTDGSFATLDLMRLPLGILTGMGFIGAGAILKKGDLVVGITTAATLWFMTVVGLCLGGGQLALGIAAFAIGMVVLKTFKSLEHLLRHQQTASLSVAGTTSGLAEPELRACALGGWVFRCVSQRPLRPRPGEVDTHLRSPLVVFPHRRAAASGHRAALTASRDLCRGMDSHREIQRRI